MASGKSKYVVADQSTYSNVGATVGQAQSNQQQLTNNFVSNQTLTTSTPTENSYVAPLYQQTFPQPNFQQTTFNTFDNTQNPIVQQPVINQPQVLNIQNPVVQNIPTNMPYQDNLNNNSVPLANNTQYPNYNRPIANEFIENQTKHISADQLLGDYGLDNSIKVEDDNYNFNIDDQISNSKDIYYNGFNFENNMTNQNFQNQPMTNQEIIIDHKNLSKGKEEKKHRNSFSKGGSYIPPQRKLKNNNKPNKAQKKARRSKFFFNMLLFVVYLLIFAGVGYFGYNYWLDQQQFFFSRESVKIVQGASFEETIYIKSKVQNNENYIFKSNDENIATVDKSGVISAITPGTTTIDVTSKDERHTGKIEVEVIPLEIDSLKVEQDEKKMYVDGTFTIIPIINGEKNIVIDLEWKSSNEEILTVSNSGIVTAHSVGMAEVTVSIPNTKHKAKVLIQVKK